MSTAFKPNASPVWENLAAEKLALERTTNLVELFRAESTRFDRMHVSAAGLTLDYSRNLLYQSTIGKLTEAAAACGLQQKIHDLFGGANVNPTENRPALHTALRDFSAEGQYRTEIAAVFAQMAELVGQVHTGNWQGCTGLRITDIVNIGIGGSHLGPMFTTDALAAFSTGHVRCHFVSNIDRTDLHAVIAGLVPETTLFIIASKSFTTLETLQNARTAREWIGSVAKTDADFARHFIAVTAKPAKAHEFGVVEKNVLPMWDWVGGRYSLWSAIGLPIAFSIGMDNFHRLRRGAAEMDRHFAATPFDRNLPVILALLGIWYINFWGARSHAVLPYLHRLRYFPEFLQQLEMESNGKSVRLDGQSVDYPTASVLWGTVETNGQHSFHQLLHQGTGLVPVDFIVSLQPDSNNDNHHPHVVANCLAQANALMVGKSREQAVRELLASGRRWDEAEQLAAHLQMSGNRPSNMIIMDRLVPESLGALIALYEHKVFVQSVVWNINAFDQWGVELGKVIGNRIHDRLVGRNETDRFDSATEAAIALYRKLNNR